MFKFGDVLRFKNEAGDLGVDEGRFMAIVPSFGGRRIDVICLIADPHPHNEWQVGEDAPCSPEEMELVVQ